MRARACVCVCARFVVAFLVRVCHGGCACVCVWTHVWRDDGLRVRAHTLTLTHTLSHTHSDLEDEIESLKLWGARVELHLHRYQALDPQLADVVAQATDNESVPPPPWLDAPTDLPPLVKAYDLRCQVCPCVCPCVCMCAWFESLGLVCYVHK